MRRIHITLPERERDVHAIQMEAATTAAELTSLSETANKRAEIDFWNATDVRETGEAEQWRKNDMERRWLLSNARLRNSKAAESQLASRSTRTALSMSGTSAAATAAADAVTGATAGRAPSVAASPASPVSPSVGAAASLGSGGALATPGGTAVNGGQAAALAPAAGRTVGSLASSAVASAAALPPSTSVDIGGFDASPCAGTSAAAAASAAAARRAAAAAAVGSFKRRMGRGWTALQTKQACGSPILARRE